MASFQIIPVPPRVKDHTGARFGRLVVVGFIGMDAGARPRPRFLCLCDCGRQHTAQSIALVRGYVKSCGCLQVECGRQNIKLAIEAGREVNRILRTTHSMSHKPEHNAWTGMKQRCHNPNNKGFGHYGARGIIVCDQWRSSFEQFYADMGPRPSKHQSLERINNDGPYAPGNVRWADRVAKATNRTDNRRVSHEGRQMTLAEAERLSGISQKVLRYRLNAGWSEAAMFSPIDRSKSPRGRL